MKSAFFTALTLLLFLTAGCGETLNGEGYDLDGYWYLSAMQVTASDDAGSKYSGPVTSFSETDTPKYIKVEGSSFVPFFLNRLYEQGKQKFTANNIYNSVLDWDESSSLLRATIEKDGITVYGNATVDYYRDKEGNPRDWNADWIINAEDWVLASGVVPEIYSLTNLSAIPMYDVPFTLSIVIRYTPSDEAHFDAWYKD